MEKYSILIQDFFVNVVSVVNSQEGYTVTLLCKENDTFHTKLFLYTFCADEKKSKILWNKMYT